MRTTDTPLNHLIHWGQSRPDVRAIILTSTMAIPDGPVDALSDYDPILVVTDVHPYFADRGWLAAFGRVLVMYRDPLRLEMGFETFGLVVQFEDGLKIDFTLWPVDLLRLIVAAPALPPEFDAGYQVLLDKDGLTAGLQPPTYRGYIPTPPSAAEYHAKIESFFLDAAYVAKFLWRDDLVAAKHILESGMLHEYLLPMLEWRMEIDHGWTVKPGPYGRRLKRWLRPDLWAALEQIYTGPDLEDNWTALFHALDLFRQVAEEVGAHLGFAYPADMDRRAVTHLRRVQNLPRDAARFV